ncbi:MAG TPA: amidohydrolase family protein [Bryobacteraceae bacterium]|nr:amidohydrolase family protein [Bryobacteraceae bacterium]
MNNDPIAFGRTTRRKIFKVPLIGSLLLGKGQSNKASDLAVTHVNIIDTTSGVTKRDQTVLIKGNKISAIDESRRLQPSLQARVVQANGKYLMPGFWDMHVHLSYTKASALPTLLASGVTSVRDCGGVLRELDSFATEVQTEYIHGPRIYRAGPQVNGKVYAFTQIAVTGAEQARGAVKALKIAGVDFIKVIAAISRDAYYGIADESKTSDILFAGHIPRALSPEECSNAGQGSLEHVDTLFDGKIPPNASPAERLSRIVRFRKDVAPALFALFAKNHTRYTPTLTASAYPYLTRLEALRKGVTDPRSEYVSNFSKRTTLALFAKYRTDMVPQNVVDERGPFEEFLRLVQMMSQSGVALLSGTDMATSVFYPGFSLHDELALLAKAGVPLLQVLQSTTCNAAKFFEAHDLGRIESDKLADLVLLDANPLEDINNTRKITAVIADGQLFDRAALDQLRELGCRMAKEE